jgi:hypothetical protein
MKNILIILLILLSTLGFSQKKETEAVTLKKAELIEMKLLSDFVAIDPKDFKSRIQGCNATKFFKGTYLNKKSINIQNNLFKVISEH